MGKQTVRRNQNKRGKKANLKEVEIHSQKKGNLSINQTVYHMGKMIVKPHEKAECPCVELLSKIKHHI